MKSKWTKIQQKNHRKKWVAALRSGEYSQTDGALHKPANNGFCCLGVACDISGLGKWEGDVYGILTYRPKTGKGSPTNLPGAVRDWLGLRTVSGQFKEADDDIYQGEELIKTSLVAKNDEEGYTFKEIADIIESEPKGLVW